MKKGQSCFFIHFELVGVFDPILLFYQINSLMNLFLYKIKNFLSKYSHSLKSLHNQIFIFNIHYFPNLYSFFFLKNIFCLSLL
jgi:hypothetical protein